MKTNADSTPVKPRLAVALATAFGTGRLPLVPGTFGSLIGVGIGWILARTTAAHLPAADRLPRAFLAGYVIINIVLAAVGVWAAERTSAWLRHKDPSSVVIDEVSGQMITFAGFLGGLAALNWKSLLAGFILFRGFDVVKPFPARRAEWLPGGWGVMADDWIAGVYAAIALWAIHRLLL